MPEDDDAGITFFFRGERAVVISVQPPENFLVGPVPVAIRKTLDVHSLAISAAEVLDHLHRTVRARIVFDEAADKSDDHDWRLWGFNRSDGRRRLRFSRGQNKRKA